MKRITKFLLIVSGLALTQSATATETSKTLAALTQNDDVLVFSAPPREHPTVGEARYAPIANYLSQILKKKVIYKHPGTWGVYRTEMLRGKYDIIFDGPHFNSYRAENLKHNILVKIPVEHQFVVIVKKDNTRFKKITQLAGHTFCTHAPPNLGTLALLSLFTNPSRQPAIVNTKGWEKIYQGVVSGKCTAGTLPIINLKKYDKNNLKTRIVFTNRVLPNQAFSAGPKLNSQEQKLIARALVAPSAKEPTLKLRAAYRVGGKFELANNSEYVGVSEYLKNEWGYY